MPFKSDTYRVLIGSPSDLADERRVATDAVNDWNAQHAGAEGVVLLPVKWETHATPETGVRPQAAINAQLVAGADILVGMFWTKLGTSSGVAASGTVEEIDRFVAAGKPAMLYFSRRPIDPNRIDLTQHAALREFRAETYRTALVGEFADEFSLHASLLRDLMSQVRMLKPRRRRRPDKIEETVRLAEMLVSFRKAKITPADVHQFRDELLGPKQIAAPPVGRPLGANDKGPNGYRLGHLKNGDLVEWLPDDENEGEEWPMLLRRNDNDVLNAATEFETVIWYDRKLVLLDRIAHGEESRSTPEIHQGMLNAMARAERKIGKRKIRSYYKDTFGWGMLNGKLSALRWVLGDDWDNLDT